MEEQREFYTTKREKIWYLPSKGKDYWHRLDGPAVESADGSKYWYVDGKQHRLDGPAFEGANGSKAWWVDGKRHRLDGPAIEYGSGTKEWWVDGKYLPEEEVEIWIKENNIDLETEEDQMAFKLRWM